LFRIDMTHESALLALEEVNLAYRALPVLQNINWSIEPGQQWACLGPNGAGKTSLANIISRRVTHASGAIIRSARLSDEGISYVCFEQQKTLCDKDKKMDDSEFRADAQDPGTRIADILLQGRIADEHYHYWVEKLRIGHILERGLRYVSTGEMRKTLLVRAILAQPAMLILDSPFDGLDIDSQQELALILDELLATPLSLVLLCRQIEDIPTGVSHVLVLQAGAMLSQGEKDQVLANAQVRELMNPALSPLATLPPAAPRQYQLEEHTPLLELNDVSVSYGQLQVLHEVNWRFDRGQHCCISGPNGCGKTTLLSLVTGDNHKAYGQNITLFGIPRGSGESVWDIKQKYGQLDTQLHLNYVRGMRVVEVVVSGFFDTIGLYDDWGDSQRDIAEQWLEALGLGKYSRESFDALSFGLQRMVLLARAMVKSPIILLLDEPALGLDGHHRTLVLRAIDHIAANSDTQIIYVSHSAGEMPACINQRLTFQPTEIGFNLISACTA
jgi:molybdate transport system ATP-binding protein